MISNIQKYTIASVLRTSMWWMAVGPLYFMERGLTAEQVYILVAVFSMGMVLFEYPTGVIADRFSYKKSIIIGGIASVLVQFLYVVPANFYFYLVVFILSAVAFTMKSGSDTALLHQISDNFQKDLAHIKSIHFVWIFLTVLIGSWLYTINITLPFLLNAFTITLSLFFFAGIKVPKNKTSNSGKSNIYQIVFDSLKHVRSNRKLRATILLAGAITAFFISYKWLAPALFANRDIPVIYLGTVLSVATLVLALATKLSGTKYYIRLRYSIPLLLLAILALGFAKDLALLAGLTFAIYFLRGFFSIRMTVLINKYTKDSIRASVLSLKSLLTRLFISVYMLLTGKILGIWSFEYLSIFTFVVLLIFVLYFVLVMANHRRKIMSV